MNWRQNWLFNKKGLDWWHILLIIGLIAGLFFVPLRKETLDVNDISWVFVTDGQQEIPPTSVEVFGGFGYTSNPDRLAAGAKAGTTLLIHPPYGKDSVYGSGQASGVKLTFPKSKITVTHYNTCVTGTSNDGVEVVIDGKPINMFQQGKEFITNQVMVYSLDYPNCDWVWFKGQRMMSLAEYLYENFFKKTTLIIPAQPFAVVALE